MPKRLGLTLLGAVISLGSACPPGNPDNVLAPRSWSQSYGGKESTGFNAVHTNLALVDFRRLSLSVGRLANSAPVIDRDGKVWIGLAGGEIVAVNPDGSQHRRRKLDEIIFATPAINNQTNEVFVVGHQIVNTANVDFLSTIYRMDLGTGLLNASREKPFATGAAPKLWDRFLFIPAAGRLKVFDQQSLTVVADVDTLFCFNLVCGGSPILEAIGDFFSEMGGCIVNLGCEFSNTAGGGGPIEEPSVAIIDQAALVGDTGKPIIVVVSPMCAIGFRFHPDGDSPETSPGIDPHFDILWSRALVSVDCDFDTVRSTSPVALPDGSVVIGDQNGRVLNLDVLTGEKRWERKLKEPVQCPPVATGLRQIYVVEKTHLATLDSDGDLMSEVPLNGMGLSAAVSLEHVHVATTEGLHTFKLIPTEPSVFNPSPSENHRPYGMAIGEDGTLWVADRLENSVNGLLVAFSPTGTLSLALAFPSISWQSPADLSTITSAPGQMLSALVSGPGSSIFAGAVNFQSDLDGPLCDAALSGGTATCATTRPLTIGTHTLTAFATDSSGGTHSAAISVQVTSTPPTLVINSPVADAVIAQGTSVNFSAEVTDPDQGSFETDTIQWHSSLDGQLGSGLAFTKVLSLGTHSVTATATDASGITGSANVTVLVTAGPVVTITAPLDNFLENDITDLTFTASVVDTSQPDFPPGGVKWTSNIDGELGTGLTITRRLSVGNHTIVATATDSLGLTGTASVRGVIFPN